MKNPELLPIQSKEGQEAKVYIPEGRNIVIKEYKTPIDKASIGLYEEQYRRLRSIYGKIIPRQRIIPSQDGSGIYYLAQAKIDPADNPNLMDQETGRLADKTQTQLESLIWILRAQYKLYKQHRNNPDAYVLPDFAKKDNFLVSKLGDIKYVDTGILQEYSRFDDQAAAKRIEGPMALLELVSGKTGAEIMEDAEYSGIALAFRRSVQVSGGKNDPDSFTDYLRDRYDLKGTLL